LGQKGSRRNIAGYALADATVADRFTLTAGVRYDDNSTYGSALSPRVSAGVEIPKTRTRIFGGVSRGFYAPTLNQYYLAVIGGTLTQRLDKEESSAFEIGVRQDFLDSRLDAEAVFFYTDYDTFINEVQLVQNAHVIGGEFALRARLLDWLETSLNYTALNAENSADGTALSYRPEHRANAEVTVTPLEHWDITATARYTGAQAIAHVLSTQALGDLQVAFFDANGVPASEALSSHFILGLSSRYTHGIGKPWLKELVYSARAVNLTNSSYQEKFGYPMPRFRFTAGVEARF
ncbi:MAG: TonB-dependent receptor, partial [Armatimonadetes bacterium]|nr:TonB-dependent receptor [Armatimonadota bacterium]